MKRRFIPILTLLVTITACQSTGSSEKLLSNVKYAKVEFKKENCPETLKECVKLTFKYPEFTTKDKALSDSIKKQINQFLLVSMYPGLFLKSFEALRDTVYKEVDSYNTHYKDTPLTVNINREASVLMDSCGIVTLSMFSKLIMGTSKPETKEVVVSISSNGSLIKLTDLFSPNYEAKLLAIAESTFRKSKGLTTTQNLFDSGFYFAEGKFALAESFAVVKKGLQFNYTITELSNEEGQPITLVIPFADLKEIINGSSVLNNFLN